jgi:hypothetical protein
MIKTNSARVLCCLLYLVAFCRLVFSQEAADWQTFDNSVQTSSYNTSKPAPTWQKIGNTGLPTQNWWIQFDKKGNMYVSSNNPSAGGVSKSTDKGFHWTVINTGFSCHLHRGMGLAPDGTLFVGNDYCNTYNEGLNHFYWLNNVSGSGTQWTTVSTPGSNLGGQINGSVIANDGKTIVSATYSGIWLSTNNARSWFLAPGSPPQGPPNNAGEGFETIKQPDGTIYAGFAYGGVFYSKDNGYHWTKLGYPPGNGTNGDVWAMATAPAGPYAGYLMVFAGNAGAQIKTGTGFWCYGPQAAPNGSWHFCGNNEYAGQMAIDVTGIVINPAHTRAIAIHYGDRGTKPVYSDDGVNWKACNTGLPPDPSTTLGGANTQGIQVDPSTGYMYIVLKNGDIYRTTQPQ